MLNNDGHNFAHFPNTFANLDSEENDVAVTVFTLSSVYPLTWFDQSEASINSIDQSEASINSIDQSEDSVSPDLLERQVVEDLCGAGSHCGHDLEPGGEIGRVWGEEGGKSVAIVRPEDIDKWELELYKVDQSEASITCGAPPRTVHPPGWSSQRRQGPQD